MANVTRSFTVTGEIQSMFTPDGGSAEIKQIPDLRVELWYKGPMEAILLGSGPTTEAGRYSISFSCESPSPMIVDGKISNVFIKVYYNNLLIAGDVDGGA